MQQIFPGNSLQIAICRHVSPLNHKYLDKCESLHLFVCILVVRRQRGHYKNRSSYPTVNCVKRYQRRTNSLANSTSPVVVGSYVVVVYVLSLKARLLWKQVNTSVSFSVLSICSVDLCLQVCGLLQYHNSQTNDCDSFVKITTYLIKFSKHRKYAEFVKLFLISFLNTCTNSYEARTDCHLKYKILKIYIVA